jgi:hypothetical protein
MVEWTGCSKLAASGKVGEGYANEAAVAAPCCLYDSLRCGMYGRFAMAYYDM